MKGVSEFMREKLSELDSCFMCMPLYCGDCKFVFWEEENWVEVIGDILQCLHFWNEVSKQLLIYSYYLALCLLGQHKNTKVGKTSF